MSGVFDRRTDKSQRREERSRRAQQEKQKTRRTTLIITAAFILIVAVSMFINSKFVRRSPAALSIGGVDFSAVEFDYFFSIGLNGYIDNMNSQLGDWAYLYLPDQNQSLSSQTMDPETGESWDDYFVEYTIAELTDMVRYYNAAVADGFALSDEQRQAIDSEIDMYKQIARMNDVSFELLCYNYFGVFNMNEATLREVMTFVQTISSYNSLVADALTFSDEEVAEYYADNSSIFDSLTFRFFQIYPEPVYDDEYESDEEYEEAYEKAYEDALLIASETAAALAAGISSEEDFIAAALEYDMGYIEPDSTLMQYPGGWLISSSLYDLGSWLLEEGRIYAECGSIDTSDGSYVVQFISRDENTYRMTAMRQILIMRETETYDYFDMDELDSVYDFDEADLAARERAEAMVSLFIEGGATEEILLELMDEYTEDSTEGGYYDLISQSPANRKLVEEIEAWLFAPERQVGDYELIRTEAYGYHFVFFMGHGERYCDYLAVEGLLDSSGSSYIIEGLREIGHAAWRDSLEPLEAVRRWAFFFRNKF